MGMPQLHRWHAQSWSQPVSGVAQSKSQSWFQKCPQPLRMSNKSRSLTEGTDISAGGLM